MENREFINTLSNCAIACENCASSCLEEENVNMLARCIKLDHDCTEICNLAINYLVRSSENTNSIIELCANICAQCAEECEKHDHDHCTECAEACRNCEESCREFLNAKVKM